MQIRLTGAPRELGITILALHLGVALFGAASSQGLEVFVNEGERVFTDLTFPSEHSRGVEFFGPNEGAKISSLKVWSLKSSSKQVLSRTVASRSFILRSPL